MRQPLSAKEFLEQESLLKLKNYGLFDEVSYVRIFLGHQIVFVPISGVLVFYRSSGNYAANPFMKQVMDSLHYNRIEIIAYDRGYLGNDKNSYISILQKAGFPYIRKVVLAPEFGFNRCNVMFMKKMTETYNPDGKKYGMISDHMSIFAKLKHLDFVLYQAPGVNPKRYYFSKKQKQPVKVFQDFINEHLYNGTEKKTQAYHFGFVYVGYFLFNFVIYLNQYAKKHNLKKIYFLKNGEMACAWYRQCFPNHKTEILQIDEETKENEELTELLVKKCRGPGILLADLSKSGSLGTKVQKLSGEPMHIADASTMFSQTAIQKYGKEINLFLKIIGFHLYTVDEYQGGFPVWKEQQAELSIHKVLREMAEGAMDFCSSFERHLGTDTELSGLYGKRQSDFMGDMIHYAFDEKLNTKLHKSLLQNITGSRAAKKGFWLLKGLYKKMKGGK